MLGLILMTLGLITSAGGCFLPRDINAINSNFQQLSTPETLGAKLRRLQATARISNPLINAPLLAVPSWQSGTGYTVGNVVSNGGNDYICYTAGTSAGSGGPTGTGAAGIPDNTVVWFYYGLTATASNSPIAPSFSILTSNPAALSNSYVVGTNDQSFFYSGGIPTSIFSGYRFPDVTLPIGQSGNAINNLSNVGGYRVSFMTDAPKFAIQSAGTTNFRIIINGQYLSLSASTNPDGNRDFAVVDFTSTGGRQPRLITFESYGAQTFYSVNVDSASMVWQPPQNDAVRAFAIGDSFTSGGNAFPIISKSDWPSQLGWLLGWTDVWNVGDGGTGLIPNNPGVTFSYPQRIGDIINNNPQVLIIQGSGHDTSFPASQVQSAMLQYLGLLRSALPKLTIFATGLFPWGGLQASMVTTEQALISAVQQFNDQNTFFIPITTLPYGVWITGTGNVASPSGTGNSDVYVSNDGGHPTQAGIGYQATRIAQAVSALIPQIN